MEVIEDVTGSNLANTPKKGNGNVCDTPKKGKLTPLDLSRTPRQRPDQLAIGFNYHADVVVKESPKTVHGEIIPIDLSRPPRERPEQIAVGFSYHSDMIVKESPRDPSGEILTESSPATPRRRARDQLAMGFSYHSKLLAKDVVVDHNENLTKAENENQDSRKEETRNNVTPEKATDVERIVPKSGKKSISDTFAVGFSYNSDLIVKESMDQANGNVDAQDAEEESKIVEKNNEEVMENGDLNGNIAELADMAGELKLAGSVWWITCIYVTGLTKYLKNSTVIWATSWENLFMPYANNKGADQPAHQRSLISAFVVCYLYSMISLVSTSEISSLWLASVAAQAVLSFTWTQTWSQVFLWRGSFATGQAVEC